MREGAFFIMMDNYSKTSDVYKMLTETNLAFPIDQFFEPDLACMDSEHSGFVTHMNRYLYEVRFSEQYRKSKARPAPFASSLFRTRITPHIIMLIGARQALVSYRNHDMLCLQS